MFERSIGCNILQLYRHSMKRRMSHGASPGIVEIRKYETKPSGTKDYLKLAAGSASVRERNLGDRWKLFLQSETGFGSLGDIMHVYQYDSFQERAMKRTKMVADPAWVEFLEKSKPYIQNQKSEIFFSVFTNFSKSQEASPGIYQVIHSKTIRVSRFKIGKLVFLGTALQSDESSYRNLEIWRFASWADYDAEYPKEVCNISIDISSRFMIPTPFSPMQ
jgi:hypothetical protein